MLTGFPIKEFKVIDKQTKEESWVSDDLIHNLNCSDVEITNESRMGYATPAWLPREENPNGCVLFLDDFSRKIV